MVLRIVLAVVRGSVVGSAVNLGLIAISGKVIAPPAGANVTTLEGLKASMNFFEPKPGPAWFNAVDLLLAYLPFAWLGRKLASQVRPAVSSGA